MPETLILPDGRKAVRPGWSPGLAAIVERERQQRGRFYVVRIGGNAGLGEVWRCKRCHGRHTYLTFQCHERPFNGLDQATTAIYQQAGDLAAVQSLDPRQRARQETKRALLSSRDEWLTLADLATKHPEMARQISVTRHLDALDVEVGGVKLGRIDQIPRSLAQRLLDLCNANLPAAGRLRVEGLTV